jgi:hypothetical protein
MKLLQQAHAKIKSSSPLLEVLILGATLQKLEVLTPNQKF